MVIAEMAGCLSLKYADLKFIGIKIHPDAIEYSQDDLNEITEFASQHKLPLFIHTGGKPSSEAIRFENLIKEYTQQIFVLCHARPAEQAFRLLDKYPNVWIDTAFLPISDLRERINIKNQERILFGTDYPVNHWYPDLPEENLWYDSQKNDIIANLSQQQCYDILVGNFNKFISHYNKKLN